MPEGPKTPGGAPRGVGAPPRLLGPPSIVSSPLLYGRLHIMKKVSPYFPKIYRGGGEGKGPLLLRERADPAAPRPPERGKSKHHHQHSS